MTELTKLQNIEITPAQDKQARLTQLIWGPSGAGKTTLAATAPGKKLLVMFDPDGDFSIANRDDVDVWDLSRASHNITSTFKDENDPLGLKKIINNYDTFIFDSITNATDKALDAGVANPLAKGSSIERPAPTSYQIRNRYALKLVKNALKLTGLHNKHCIFIAHQDTPTKNDEGAVLFITIALGGSLPDSVPIDFSEVWALYDVNNGKEKKIAIRPCRQRQPMKTRMFSTMSDPEFTWKFNPETLEGDTIEKWYNQWLQGGRKKLPLPK